METIRIMRIMRSKLLSVAENQPRYGGANAPGTLVFPWGEGMQLGKWKVASASDVWLPACHDAA